MINLLKVIAIVVSILGLTSCATTTVYEHDYGASIIQTRVNLLNKKLASYNTRIFVTNDSVSFILPDKTFFISGSANFTEKAYKALDLIFSFVNDYDRPVVSVTGFVRTGSIEALDEAIANERAHKVSQRLLALGIDANFVYVNTDNNNDKIRVSDCVIINFRKFK